MCNKTRAKRQDRETKFRLRKRQEARRIIENRNIDKEVIYLYSPELEK